MTYWLSTSKKTWFINLWKVDGALVRLNGITIHLKRSGQKKTTMLVLRGDPDLIVPHSQVYLRKVACFKQTIKQILDG